MTHTPRIPILALIFGIIGLFAISPMAQAAVGSRVKPSCNSRLQSNYRDAKVKRLSGLELAKSLPKASVIAYDQGLYETAVVTYAVPGSSLPVRGEFRGYMEDFDDHDDSPKNAIAAFKFDQLLGAPALIPAAVELEVRGKKGVFAEVPFPRENRYRKGLSLPATQRHQLALFDFLTQNFPRSRQSVMYDEEGQLRPINNWNSFGLISGSTPIKLGVRDAQVLVRSWRESAMSTRGAVLSLSPEALAQELGDVLSPDQRYDLWERIQYLKALVKKAP